MPDSSIRIAAVDDHPLFLDGLRRALRLVEDFELIGEGGSAMDAQKLCAEKAPDVLLLDIGIPGGGLEAAKAIGKKSPGTKIIILTGSDDDDLVGASIAAGVRGFLQKGSDIEEIFHSIRIVQGGEPYIAHSVATRLLIQRLRADLEGESRSKAKQVLGARECQVLDYAADGLTNKEIADKLGLTVRTVKNYMSRVLSKLQAPNRLAAIASYREDEDGE
ncbi:MAG: response regulator transcription factor [Hyphomicrobium sp.]|nr:response regulator transcription factor [Hyphomicrobium sp.]